MDIALVDDYPLGFDQNIKNLISNLFYGPDVNFNIYGV